MEMENHKWKSRHWRKYWRSYIKFPFVSVKIIWFVIFPNSSSMPLKFVCITVATAEGETLTLSKVTRSEMGTYLCIASNGVPPSVSKRMMLHVHCKWALISFHRLFSKRSTSNSKIIFIFEQRFPSN